MNIAFQRPHILELSCAQLYTNGSMSIVLECSGDKIVSCSPEIGYNHRGIEKIVENTKFLSIFPFLNKLDYIAPSASEHTFVLLLEQILDIYPTKRALLIRIIIDELYRIASHILALGNASKAIGNMLFFQAATKERQKIWHILWPATGIGFYIPGGVVHDISDNIWDQIKLLLNQLDFYLHDVEKYIFNNRIFQKRTKGIGYISSKMACEYGISGVNLRSSGMDYDIRKHRQYGAYEFIKFESIILADGDCFARNNLRFLEIKQSIDIMKQCFDLIVTEEYYVKQYEICEEDFGTLNELLYADLFLRGLELPKNSTAYAAVESPRGEFGIHMFTRDEQTQPYRMHFKSPSFAHIQLLKELLIGEDVENIASIVASLDFVVSETDR